MNYINLNGKLTEAAEAAILPDNRAFRYGYGLFETMLVQNGEIRLAAYHWERLFSGAKKLYFEIPKLLTTESLQEEVLKTVRKNKLEQLCRVRLQLYAGNGGLYDGNNTLGYVIECFKLDEHMLQPNEAGLVLAIALDLQKSNDSLANYKTSNALIYAIAAKQAKENKWNDALICNTAGQIIESTIANIFWVKDGQFFTPPLADGCVAGVMRRHIMAKKLVIETSLTPAILEQADALYLTNAIRRIKWVRSVGSAQFSVGGIHSLYRELFD